MHHAPLTNPVDFIDRLRYKGIQCGRKPSQYVLHALCEQLKQQLNINTDSWPDVTVDANDVWHALHPSRQNAVLPILDMARHMLDAFPSSATPMEMPGLVLMDQPETFCTPGRFKDYMTLLDNLFPPAPVYPVDQHGRRRKPSRISSAKASPPPGCGRTPEQTRACSSAEGDGPFDRCGRTSPEPGPDEAIHSLSAKGAYRTAGKKRLSFGRSGQGLCIHSVLYSPVCQAKPAPAAALRRQTDPGGARERTFPHTCPMRWRPCMRTTPSIRNWVTGPSDSSPEAARLTVPSAWVPPKEGKPRQVSNLDTLLEGGRLTKLILLDDNILSHPNANRFLLEMAEKNVMVNFTQTLDLRLVNRERAKLLRRIQCSNTRFTRRNFHFSLNHNQHLDRVARKYRLFDFKPRDNVEFICMYGFDTTLADDVERFRFLRSLPGAYVFTQKYLPIKGGPPPDTQDFFGMDPEPLIDQLVGIMFSQNMKSVENYYRWVSRRYAETYGKLHMGLVDTIFRYNQRHKKGGIYCVSGWNKKKALLRAGPHPFCVCPISTAPPTREKG